MQPDNQTALPAPDGPVLSAAAVGTAVANTAGAVSEAAAPAPSYCETRHCGEPAVMRCMRCCSYVCEDCRAFTQRHLCASCADRLDDALSAANDALEILAPHAGQSRHQYDRNGTECVRHAADHLRCAIRVLEHQLADTCPACDRPMPEHVGERQVCPRDERYGDRVVRD